MSPINPDKTIIVDPSNLVDVDNETIEFGPGNRLRVRNLGITRAKLEYPTVDVNFAYLSAIGKVRYGMFVSPSGNAVLTTDVFANRAVETICSDESPLLSRWIDMLNFYDALMHSGAATADFKLRKMVGGVSTLLGAEAVDLSWTEHYLIKFSCSDTTLKAYRDDMATPKISVTDTSFAEGRFGVGHWGSNIMSYSPLYTHLRPSSSPAPKVLAYFEAPIVGSGTMEDPFRAEMPEEVVSNPAIGKRNLLSVSYSSLIPTDLTTGKPKHGTTIVRVFEQPDRGPQLRPIPYCLNVMKRIRGVKELKQREATVLAKRMDDKLEVAVKQYLTEEERW